MSLPFASRAEPRRRGGSPARRPVLRVVEPAPRRRVGRTGTIAGIVLFTALFALAAFQTVLIRTQARIDDLDRRITAEEDRRRDLTLRLADLRSPDRIVSVARDRLGMISPATVAYLQPGPDDDARATYRPSPVPDDPGATSAGHDGTVDGRGATRRAGSGDG
jgi:cell division protein FtsB